MAFPSTALDFAVELELDGVWTAVPKTDLRLASPGGPVTIGRGRKSEAGHAESSSMALTINNRNGTYSPRNPMSSLYGLIGRNTGIRVRMPDIIADTFTRTTSNGWGTSNTGQAWTVNGTASEYSTNGSSGRIAFNAVNASRYTWLAGNLTDLDITGSFSTDELATGATLDAGFTARYQSTGAHYLLWLTLAPAATVSLDLYAIAAGGASSLLGSALTSITHVANTAIKVRFALAGTTLKGKAWLASGSEPAAWDIEEIDDAIGGAGRVGCRCRCAPGNTNGSVTFIFDNVTASDIRFTGEVSHWPQDWDVSGRDVYTQIEASGIGRRLGEGASPLQSMLRRGLGAQTHVEYWAMEDGQNATGFAPASPGHATLIRSAEINPAASDFPGLGGSQALAVIGTGGTLRAAVAMGTATAWTVELVVNVQYASAADADLLSWKTPGGTPAWWRIRMRAGGGIAIEGCDSSRVKLAAFDGLLTYTAAADGSSGIGRWAMIVVTAAQNGANIDYSLEWRFADEPNTQGLSWSDTGTLAKITGIDTGPYSSQLDGTAIGHLFITDDDSGGLYGRDDSAFLGGVSETSAGRISRLCAENGLACTIVGDPALSAAVGPQATAELLQLLQDAGDVDQGLLFEMRGEVGYAYRTQRSLLNQHLDPAFALDYAAGHIAPPIKPVEDDQHLRNDVTVTRAGGSSGRAVVTTGPLSTQPPPNGVGTYDTSITVNAFDDDQLADAASWRAHLGTWDEARYATVRINMAAPAVAGNPVLTRQIAAADLGDCFTIDNPPTWVAPDIAELLIQGSVEELGYKDWVITVNAVPAGPYRAFVVEDTELGRADTSGSSLASSATSAATSLSVAFDLAGDHWSTTASDFDIEVGGERMTATAISGTSSPQTFTVTRSVNGVVKAHAGGTPVRLWRPGVAALT